MATVRTLVTLLLRRRHSLLLTLLALALATPAVTLAHPADVYLQAAYLTIAPDEIVVELDLTPGVLVAPQILPLLDTDGDQAISDAEGRAYAATVLPSLALQLDGRPLTLTVTNVDTPTYLAVQSGYGAVRVFTSAALEAGLTGAHTLSFTNGHAPAGASYQVNTFVARGADIALGAQRRDSLQQSVTVEYTIGGAAGAAGAASAPQQTTQDQLLGSLYTPTSAPPVLALALALALALGGLHALTPGHGKTLVAAYLVGSRGTVRHAVLLGAVVTITHTASVIAIGLLTLFASQSIVPSALTPALEVASGLLVVIVGARLVWQRWIDLRRRRGHAHTHDHGDGHVHAHLPPEGRVTAGGLLAMGVSGGIAPCPEALGILVIAIGLNRVAFGLGLIVAFSLGLAAVLIAIGVLLVRARPLVERMSGIGGGWRTAIPLASAAIVTALGIGITVSGLASYLG